MNLVPMVVLGVAAGIIGGMFGIGGGLVIVPALILFLSYGQKEAIGTSLLAQLLPVGLLGVFEYWRRNEVNVSHGLAIAVGLLFGAWIGSLLAGAIPKEPMKQGYGVFLIAVGLYFLISPSTPKGKSDQPNAAVHAPKKQPEAHIHLPSDLS